MSMQLSDDVRNRKHPEIKFEIESQENECIGLFKGATL